MLQPVEKEIDGYKYLYRPMTAKKATRLYVRIMKILAPLQLAGQGGSNAAAAMTTLFTSLSEDSVESIIAEFVEHSEVDGVPLKGKYEFHFATKMTHQIAYLAFCYEAQYGDFLLRKPLHQEA